MFGQLAFKQEFRRSGIAHDRRHDAMNRDDRGDDLRSGEGRGVHGKKQVEQERNEVVTRVKSKGGVAATPSSRLGTGRLR